MGLESGLHLRIVNPVPDDDFVGKRKTSITKLSNRLRKQVSLAQQLVWAGDVIGFLGGDAMRAETRALVADYVGREAPSFVDDGTKDNELGVVFALATGAAIDVSPQSPFARQMKFLAGAIDSGLAYLEQRQDPQLEGLRTDLLGHVRADLEKGAEDVRGRSIIPNDINDENYAQIMSAIAENARWDREEIDLLWWVVNDWSVIADRRVSELAPEAACIVSALETSGLLAGPAAAAHRNIAVRHVGSLDALRAPKDFADASTGARAWARHALARSLQRVSANPAVFPALGLATLPDGDEIPQSLLGGATLSVSNWCRRLVDELGLLKLLGDTVSLTPSQ